MIWRVPESGSVRAFVVAGLAALAVAAPLRAQINVDSLRADSLRADSLRADSLRRRQSEQTTRFLEESRKNAITIAALNVLGADGPRPAGARIVFNRDSLDWAMAETVGDLIARAPGVFLWRSGWTGSLEQPNYRGQGPTAVEYYVDGLPFVALGPDSVVVDATMFGLFLLERVEIEPLPGLLRVWLFTRRHERLAPRSRIGLARGDNDFARYQGTLERRVERGLSFGLGGDYINSGSTSFTSNDFFRNTQLWGQLSYMASPTVGFQAQLLRTSPRRVAVPAGTGTATIPIDGERSDWLFRAQLGPRGQDVGQGLDIIAQRSTWSGDGVEHRLWQLGGMARLRTPTLGLGASAFYRSQWTTLDASAKAAWTPSPRIALDAEGVYRLHTESRSTAWVAGRASLALAGPFSLRGSARLGQVVAAPSLDTSQSQSITEVEGRAALTLKWLEAYGGVARTSRFAQASFPSYPIVTSLAEHPAITWVTAGGAFRPFNWMAIEGWYSHPTGEIPDGQPPEQLSVNGSLRTKFLRHFKSGVFELKGELGLERWGQGVIGRDATGAAIIHPSATYLRGRAMLRLQTFMIYFERANITNETIGYVPGLTIPNLATTFGFRWEFTN